MTGYAGGSWTGKPDSLDPKLQTSGLGSEWREARVSNMECGWMTEAGIGASVHSWMLSRVTGHTTKVPAPERFL